MITAICVDDHPQEVKLITRILTEHGVHVVATARDGISGLEEIRKHRPTIAVLDFMLGQMEGINVFRAMRAEGIETHVFFASGSGAATIKKQCFDAGAIGFYVKPYDDISTWNAMKVALKKVGLWPTE